MENIRICEQAEAGQCPYAMAYIIQNDGKKVELLDGRYVCTALKELGLDAGKCPQKEDLSSIPSLEQLAKFAVA